MEEKVGSFTIVKKGGKEEIVPNMKDAAMAERKKNADKADANAKKQAKAEEKAAAAAKEVSGDV
jgi:hypothetical protein